MSCMLLLTLTQFLQITGNDLKVSVLNVGQGDSILIQTAEHKNILIDAGESGQVIDELGNKINFFNKTIDLAIITHPHADHFGGFLELIQKYPIKQIMLTGAISKDPKYIDLLNKIRNLKIPIIFPQNNQDLQISNNIYLDIIYPFAGQSLIGQDVSNKNNISIITKLITDSQSQILLTGDAEHEQEREILLSGQDIQSPILKLGHHGSKTATSDAFLSAVKPQTAIISAGVDNKFGHPHQEIIDKLSDIQILQTVDGTIEFSF